MEADVFGYFVAIGAGVSFGLTLGSIPALLVWKWMKKRGDSGGVFQTPKARSRA